MIYAAETAGSVASGAGAALVLWLIVMGVIFLFRGGKK